MADKGPLWDNDLLQFARLLSKIVATQGLNLSVLRDEMGVERADLVEILERAHKVWSEFNERTHRTEDGYTFRKVGDTWTDGDMTFPSDVDGNMVSPYIVLDGDVANSYKLSASDERVWLEVGNPEGGPPANIGILANSEGLSIDVWALSTEESGPIIAPWLLWADMTPDKEEE